MDGLLPSRLRMRRTATATLPKQVRMARLNSLPVKVLMALRSPRDDSCVARFALLLSMLLRWL